MKMTIDNLWTFWYSNKAPDEPEGLKLRKNAMMREIAGTAWSLPRSMSGVGRMAGAQSGG